MSHDIYQITWDYVKAGRVAAGVDHDDETVGIVTRECLTTVLRCKQNEDGTWRLKDEIPVS